MLDLLQPDEPSPIEVLNERATSPFVIVCDHAGRRFPRALGTLGLSAEDAKTHIAWDLGARAVAAKLALALDAALFTQRYSRLVIDCNRPLGAPDSIPDVSGGIHVPGNRGLTRDAAEHRAAAIFEPYHARIRAALAQRRERPYVLIALHSFTPVLYGVARPFHAGVLFHRDTRLAKPLLELLRREPGLVVGENEPYAASEGTDYSLIEHAERRGAPCVELEIRQDLLSSERDQSSWAERLAHVLRCACESVLTP
jgi:predicted N-formylglutamate amidohydrolase